MPKTNNGQMRFITVGDDLVVGFEEAEDRGNNDMERDNNMVGLLRSPLEVMLRSYLDGRGEREGKGYNGFVVCKME